MEDPILPAPSDTNGSNGTLPQRPAPPSAPSRAPNTGGLY
jgi:hypothetical protein